ncbi:MAG TPA: twin-arginine translocation signal domain-containing protein, partial [Planctomycetota bacterium]|nr:twin-arginine translocation signal domain-containing protein [Planctomycetota bacterium]
MPLFLPPLSHDGASPTGLSTRRSFLAKVTRGAAGLLLAGAARPGPARAEEGAADGKDQKRPSWALLSDTHIHESLTEENQGQN